MDAVPALLKVEVSTLTQAELEHFKTLIAQQILKLENGRDALLQSLGEFAVSDLSGTSLVPEIGPSTTEGVQVALHSKKASLSPMIPPPELSQPKLTANVLSAAQKPSIRIAKETELTKHSSAHPVFVESVEEPSKQSKFNSFRGAKDVEGTQTPRERSFLSGVETAAQSTTEQAETPQSQAVACTYQMNFLLAKLYELRIQVTQELRARVAHMLKYCDDAEEERQRIAKETTDKKLSQAEKNAASIQKDLLAYRRMMSERAVQRREAAQFVARLKFEEKQAAQLRKVEDWEARQRTRQDRLLVEARERQRRYEEKMAAAQERVAAFLAAKTPHRNDTKLPPIGSSTASSGSRASTGPRRGKRGAEERLAFGNLQEDIIHTNVGARQIVASMSDPTIPQQMSKVGTRPNFPESEAFLRLIKPCNPIAEAAETSMKRHNQLERFNKQRSESLRFLKEFNASKEVQHHQSFNHILDAQVHVGQQLLERDKANETRIQALRNLQEEMRGSLSAKAAERRRSILVRAVTKPNKSEVVMLSPDRWISRAKSVLQHVCEDLVTLHKPVAMTPTPARS